MMFTAVDDGRIRRNPCRIKGADKESAPERRTGSVRQVYRLADGIGGRYRVLVLAAAFLGLRWGELLGLRRMDVDLAERTIKVQRSIGQLTGGRLVVGPPKSPASVRTVTIPDVLVDELRDHVATYVGPGSDALLFIGAEGRDAEARKLAGLGELGRTGQGGQPARRFPLPRSAAHRERSGGEEWSLDA